MASEGAFKKKKKKKDTFDWRLGEGACHLGGLLEQLGVFWWLPVLRPSGSSHCLDCGPRQLLHRCTGPITDFIYLGPALCQPLNRSRALYSLGLPPLRWWPALNISHRRNQRQGRCNCPGPAQHGGSEA